MRGRHRFHFGYPGPPPVVEKGPVSPEESDWSFRIAPYAWLLTVRGTVTVMGLPSEIHDPIFGGELRF